MKKLLLGLVGLFVLGSAVGAIARLQVASVPEITASPQPAPRPLRYRDIPLERGTAHVLQIPADGTWVVTPAIAPGLRSVSQFAEDTGAIAVLNGGFFDPNNQQTTSFVIKAGEVLADPARNARLSGNPELAPYLDAILNRSEFRRYDCAGDRRYDITPHSDPVPANCTLLDALGGGPQLLPELTDETEAFVAYAGGQRIRDALGRDSRNARTAIGITASGDILWVVAAQASDLSPQSGASFPELATLLQELGAHKALNLDGGSSSGMYYEGTSYFGKFDGQAQPIERPVKSVLLLRESSR